MSTMKVILAVCVLACACVLASAQEEKERVTKLEAAVENATAGKTIYNVWFVYVVIIRCA